MTFTNATTRKAQLKSSCPSSLNVVSRATPTKTWKFSELAPHSTAPHPTAQHSAAQRSTAQHVGCPDCSLFRVTYNAQPRFRLTISPSSSLIAPWSPLSAPHFSFHLYRLALASHLDRVHVSVSLLHPIFTASFIGITNHQLAHHSVPHIPSGQSPASRTNNAAPSFCKMIYVYKRGKCLVLMPLPTDDHVDTSRVFARTRTS